MKLSVEKCMTLHKGLECLDYRFDKVVEDGRNKKVIQAPYNLSKKVRIENGIRLMRLEAPIKTYNKEREKLVEKYGKEIQGVFQVAPENSVAYSQENQEFLDVEIEVDLPALAVDELKLDENDVPGTVLAYLAPILTGEGF